MKTNPVFQDIHDKIYKRGENCIVIFVGKVRRGKSFCSLSLTRFIDEKFTIKRNCIYEITKFFQLINEAETKECGVVIEELGVKADKRRFMSLQNLIISHLLQTFAYKGVFLCLNCPSMAFVDSRFEPMIDYVFIVDKAYKNGDKLVKTRFRVKKYQHNPETGKTYKKLPRFYINGKLKIIRRITIPVPDEDTIAEYKHYSHIYKAKLGRELEDKINDQIEKDTPKKPTKTDDEIIAEVLANKERYLGTYKGRPHISQPTIIENFGLGGARAYRIGQKINKILVPILHQPSHSV